MKIQSIEFFVFTAAILAIYYFLPFKKQNYLLLAASYFFYCSISFTFALVLLIITVGNYLLGMAIITSIKIEHGRSIKWLYIGIGFNLLAFFFFKRAGFFSSEIIAFLSHQGFSFQSKGLKLILPIGLSFYILQAISYLVDAYRRQISTHSNAVDFALYLAYFPKLTAGPIERASTFLSKLAKQRQVDNDLLARSFTLIIIGLVRKIVIADILLQAIPANFFKTPSQFSTFELASWLFAFTIGVYNDFCGYTNIVRGISGFFGIQLSRNFNNPIFSRNFSELWTRWHITLSEWLRDYIYFPFMRSLLRKNFKQYSPFVIILPPLITMLASGIWHGLSFNWLIWGSYMGIMFIFDRILSFRKPVTSHIQKPVWRQVLGTVTVIFLAITSLGFAFMADMPASIELFKSMLHNTQWRLPQSRAFIVIIPSFLIDFIQYKSKEELVFLSWRMLPRSLILALAFLAIFLFSFGNIGELFIYQGF